MNIMKNIMNAKNILGKSKNSLGKLSNNKNRLREKGRRRYNLAMSLLPKDRG